MSILGGFICNSTYSARRLRRGPKSFFRSLIVPPPCFGSPHRQSALQSSAVVIDPPLKCRLVHINQEVEEMQERLSCGAGGGRIEVLYPCAGDGLVFRCRVDRAIAEWRVEQGDLWDLREGVGKGTHHELSTDFFKVPLACGVESSGSSFGDRRR